MKTTILSFVLFFITLHMVAQDSIHVQRIYYYDGPVTKTDSAFHKLPNTIFIFLDEGFDDSICIAVNNRIVLNTYLKTNESIGYASHFGVYFKDSMEKKLLVIKFQKTGTCIKEQIDFRFKSLQVRKLKQWELVYSNRFPMRE